MKRKIEEVTEKAIKEKKAQIFSTWSIDGKN